MVAHVNLRDKIHHIFTTKRPLGTYHSALKRRFYKESPCTNNGKMVCSQKVPIFNVPVFLVRECTDIIQRQTESNSSNSITVVPDRERERETEPTCSANFQIGVTQHTKVSYIQNPACWILKLIALY
jgi:hypothetical protein